MALYLSSRTEFQSFSWYSSSCSCSWADLLICSSSWTRSSRACLSRSCFFRWRLRRHSFTKRRAISLHLHGVSSKMLCQLPDVDFALAHPLCSSKMSGQVGSLERATPRQYDPVQRLCQHGRRGGSGMRGDDKDAATAHGRFAPVGDFLVDALDEGFLEIEAGLDCRP